MNSVYPVCLTVIVLGLLGFAAWRQVYRLRIMRAVRPAPDPEPMGIARLWRDPIVVTMKTGETFSGVLWEQSSRELVLRGAEAIGAAEKGENLAVDGELLIFVADIAYVQKP